MTLSKFLGPHFAAIALAGLVGCGGGGGTTAPAGGGGQPPAGTPPAGPVLFSGASDSMAVRISDARTLGEATTFGARTVGIDRTPGEENALADGEDITFRIFRSSPDAVPTFVVTLDGGTTTFGPEHAPENKGYEIDNGNPDQRKWLWTWSGHPLEHAGGYWGDFTDGNVFVPNDDPISRKYHVPVGLYYNGDPIEIYRMAVIGLETGPGDMLTRGRARYDGHIRTDLYWVDGGGRTRLNGDLTLTVDFSENTIGGTTSGWENPQNPDQDLSLVSHVVTPTTFTGNAFTTTLAPAPSCTHCSEVLSSTVAGKFYGPASQEIGGTMEARYRHESGRELLGVSVFYTDRK